MSLYAMSWAFSLTLPPNEKIVLLALADCENEETLRCDPSQPFLAKKASLGERTVREMLKLLEQRGLITRTKRGGRGEGRQSDNYRLACRGPVDNSMQPADSAVRATGKFEGGYRQTAAGIEARTGREPELDPVPQATTDAIAIEAAVSAGSDGLEAIAHPSPRNLATLRGHGLSCPDVFASVGDYLEPTSLDDEGLTRLAEEILSVAPTRVVNPTSYVIRAIRNPKTRYEWIARAWVIAGEVHVERAIRKAAG